MSEKLRRTLFAGGALLLLATLAGCGGGEKEKVQAAESVSGLRIEKVQLQTVPDEVEAPGTLRSATTAPLAARVMGTVVDVAVREGDMVKRGQLLVALDERELVAHRNAARAALDEAKAGREEVARGLAMAQAQADVASKTYERFQFLKQQKSVSPQEFDEVEAKFRSAQAGLAAAKARQEQVEATNVRAESEVRAAETMAGYSRIVAPFDGVVVRRSVDPGVMAAPGIPLVEVEDTSRYQMDATLAASVAAARGLKRGTRARVQLDALPGREFEGTITELEAGADPASQTVQARVTLGRDPALRSGFFGRVLFCCGERQALVVPRTAVVERGQLRGVYVVGADGNIQLRLVTLGRSFSGEAGERVEVLSGLDTGETIVLVPGTQNLDGKKLEAGR
jgi:RND family efflux transporter MFP subunit